MSNPHEFAKLSARLTAVRELIAGRTCEPTRYAAAGSAWSVWYRTEYEGHKCLSEAALRLRADDHVAMRRELIRQGAPLASDLFK